MEKLCRVIQKQKKQKRHKYIEFCNSIQDWVLTNVYQLEKCKQYIYSGWKAESTLEPPGGFEH